MFNNSNLNSFRVVTYGLWSLKDGSRTALIMLSKVKLALILQLGDVYHNKLCLVVFVARLKTLIQDQTHL